MTWICRDFQWAAEPPVTRDCEDLQGPLSATRGLASGGVRHLRGSGEIATKIAFCARAKFLRNFSKRSAKDAAKFWRNFSQIFVLQFPGKMAAKNFTKNPRHFPRCTKLSFFTAATRGASGPATKIAFKSVEKEGRNRKSLIFVSLPFWISLLCSQRQRGPEIHG